MIQPYLDRFPLVAILRGVTPDEVVGIGQSLVDQGFTIIEVPLNSPEPFESIRRLAKAFGRDVLIGAGTVTEVAQVCAIGEAGGRLVVMPHSDAAVIRAAKAADMACLPGVATPTEAFAALREGADGLKAFPAEVLPPVVIKAWRSVLPKHVRLLPVGGITPQAISAYIAAGASGFGLGSALYKPGMDAGAVSQTARQFADAWQSIHSAD
ncbi:2-dehydro-3-deoxy-6-phosphogalactonate aldolase [Cupriavidus sp. D384]|uniref:2-dehydro-3-deoxy-6-phosphogalactonate aldolase n=1 Tax=Cupriavidus sp. D384 TaxID=1538095 RepID=UPI00082ECC22|nr:2-dehydro-3-deoxy-6-phosphogalactonate aldolase [Cupriavidus sp. D384]